MADLILKNGSFYRDGEKVPLEFGNKEQIRLMQEQMQVITALKEGLVLEPDIEEITTYSAEVRFKCICGTRVSKTLEELDDNDPLEVINRFDGLSRSCYKCQRKYYFSINEDGDLIAKLA